MLHDGGNDNRFCAGWRCDEEKLLSLVALDDGEAPKLSHRAGEAYFRAFIVQDRKTNKVSMKLRYHYKDPDEKSWYEVAPDRVNALTVAEAVEELKAGIKYVMDEAAELLGEHLHDEAIQFFDPPDDGGDPMRTVLWLDEKDLVEVKLEPCSQREPIDEERAESRERTSVDEPSQ